MPRMRSEPKLSEATNCHGLRQSSEQQIRAATSVLCWAFLVLTVKFICQGRIHAGRFTENSFGSGTSDFESILRRRRCAESGRWRV